LAAWSATSGDGNVLFVVHHERNRRPHAAGLIRGNVKELFAGVGCVGEKATVIGCLEDKIAGSCQSAPADAASTLNTPLLFLSRGIDCDEPAAGVGLTVLVYGTDAR
jgi:hypothetical protein